MATLPVDIILADLKQTLRGHRRMVLQAPPGAGKTTRVPPALLTEAWLAGKRLVLLEPRRLAARRAADYMARQMGQQVGQIVGYRVRLDSRVGPETRIEVVTEGVLTRMLQRDPALEGVGAVIFDEFHERSLDGDLALALCLDLQTALNEALRLVVMSATLEVEPLARLLGGAPVLTCSGRTWPVRTAYLPPRPDLSVERATAAAVQLAARREEGSILVFLPGAGERDPAGCGARPRRRPGARVGDPCALRQPSPGGAGSGRRTTAARPPQGGSGHQYRGNQPHHRRGAGGGGQRVLPRPAF